MSTLQTLTYRPTLDAFKNGIQRILQGWVTGENLSRKIEISLQSGESTYELPFTGVTASMYVTTPSGVLSINACTIDAENNKIIYEVLPTDIQEAGIVNMQLKVFDNHRILISPSFGLEVWESTIDDSQAVESPTYTALTVALAQAQAFNDSAFAGIYIEDDYTFVAEYADGTDYRSNAIKDAVALVEGYSLVAEGWAKGTQDGEPVEEGSPYYHNNSEYFSGAAHGYANMAENAKTYAYGYANDALGYKNDASGFADTAESYKDAAGDYVDDAHDEYIASKSYAVGNTGTRAGEDNDNSKYYKERCEQIAASIEGGFVPMGTVLFENLPTTGVSSGWMYNISNDFVSDSRFEDGGGIAYPAGTNVYFTAQNKWDCLSSPYQTAGNTAYDNTDSGLEAENVQDAIDEIVDGISGMQSDISDLIDDLDGKQDSLTFDNVPTEDSDNPVKSGGVYDALDGVASDLSDLSDIVEDKSDKTDIAYVEKGLNASRGYYVGEFVYVNGVLYRVIANITSGSAFTVGTNIQQTSIGQELSKITAGTIVSIASYTSASNAYTVPSDGYVTLFSNTAKSGTFGYRIADKSGNGICSHHKILSSATPNYDGDATFVRAGLKVNTIGTIPNGADVRFVPLI